MNQKVTTERFLEQAKILHGDKYEYAAKLNVKQIETPITILCKKHGTTFVSSYRSHIVDGYGCYECGRDKCRAVAISRRGSKEQFVEKATQVHGTKYNYDRVVYSTCKTKVEIVCNDHGTFYQSPNMHISNKQGCPECYADRRHILAGGYKRALAMHHNDTLGHLYLMRFVGESESFLKIGITTRDVAARWGKVEHMGYKLEILHQEEKAIKDAYAVEQQCISLLGDAEFYNKTRLRNGNTECFVDTPELVDKLLEIIRK